MIRWFTKHPEVISIFPSYKGNTIDQLKANKMTRLKQHGKHIFDAITGVATAFGDEAKLDALLKTTVEIHVPHKPNIDAVTYNV